jgi:hypothetical protein
LAVPEFELRASHFLGRCSTTWAIPPAQDIFKIGSLDLIFPSLASNQDPPVLCLPSS